MPALGYLVFTANKTLSSTVFKWVKGSDRKRFTLALSLESLRIRATPKLKLILRYCGAAPIPQLLMTERCIDVFLIWVKPICLPLSHS